MELNSWYTAAWGAWILAFVVIESAAIFRRAKGDTLTEHIRKWLALSSRTKWAGRLLLIGVFVWLAFHFFVPKP